MKVSRKWLQKYFETELPSADELAELFIRHSFEVEGVEEVGDDHVLDIDVLPNRSSDCLSHRGIARELATLLSVPMKQDPLRENLPAWNTTDQLTVSVDDPVLCPRYIAAIMRGVTVRESPEWLRSALETLGQRSINNIVDATNYVMLDLGQPLHAFDLSLLAHDPEQKRHICVRLAKNGEKITTLTNDEYELKDTHQLIADAVSGDPLALAGIKGGKQAEVTEGTVDVVLESANFNYVNVRKTSSALKLSTDASLRFQNEPSAQLTVFALKELIELIEDVADGKLVGVVDAAHDELSENEPVEVTLSEINTLLGITLTVEQVENILVRFEWEFSRNGEEFVVTGPWERTDIHIKQDLIEEIGRIYGYLNIVSKPLSTLDEEFRMNKKEYYIEKVQKHLLSLGYSEVLTYTLVESGEVELLNPLASDKAYMRSGLSSGIEKALQQNAQNAPLLGLDMVRLFEVGTVFLSEGERTHLAVGCKVLAGKQAKADALMKEEVEGLIENIFTVAREVKVKDGVCEIELDELIVLAPEPVAYDLPHEWDTEARFTPWSSYPYMLRDIAVWVPKGTTADMVRSVIVAKATELLVRCDLFDTFEKEDRVSYAWHLVFQSKEKTLTDEEVGKIMQAVTDDIHDRDGWEVR